MRTKSIISVAKENNITPANLCVLTSAVRTAKAILQHERVHEPQAAVNCEIMTLTEGAFGNRKGHVYLVRRKDGQTYAYAYDTKTKSFDILTPVVIPTELESESFAETKVNFGGFSGKFNEKASPVRYEWVFKPAKKQAPKAKAKAKAKGKKK